MNYDNCFKNYLFDIAGKQKRLGGRLKATPFASFNEYRFSAKVDKLIIKFEIVNGLTGTNGTNFSSIKKVLDNTFTEKYFVEPTTSDNKNKRSWNEYLVTFQDPNIRTIQAASDMLDSTFGLRVPPTLHEMEIAVDMTSDSVSERLRARDVLEKHFLPPDEFGDIKPRLYNNNFKNILKKKYKKSPPLSLVNKLERGTSDTTLYFGHKSSDVYWKIYHKVKDRVKRNDGTETSTSIIGKDRSERIEVTLAANGLTKVIG